MAVTAVDEGLTTSKAIPEDENRELGSTGSEEQEDQPEGEPNGEPNAKDPTAKKSRKATAAEAAISAPSLIPLRDLLLSIYVRRSAR